MTSTSVSGTDADPAAEHGLPEVARAVAIIMDGNGRWAASRGVSVAEGHRAGSRALRPVVETAIDLGVDSLAVYAFSTENWTRPGDEVEALMEIFGETIDRELVDLAKEGVRTRFVGRRDRAPVWLQEKLAELEAATEKESRLNLWIAFDYGGRAASGELRVSNFLLWQSAYAEFVFTDTLWPDFGPDEFRAAIEDYASRRRRFGGR